MNDAEYESVKQRIVALQEKWNQLLGINAWDMMWCYHRDGLKEQKNQFYTAAHTEHRWEYLTASVSFSMPELLKMEDWELESVYVHEMCHLLVAEMQEADGEHYQAHVERTCTLLERAFRRVMEGAEQEEVPVVEPKCPGPGPLRSPD